MSDRIRLSLDVDAKAKAQIEIIRKRTGAASLTDIIRRAVALYDLVTEHVGQGGKLVFRHADGREETLRLL